MTSERELKPLPDPVARPQSAHEACALSGALAAGGPGQPALSINAPVDPSPTVRTNSPAPPASLEGSSGEESDSTEYSVPAATGFKTTNTSASASASASSSVSFKSWNTVSSRKSKINMSQLPPGTVFLR
ncbi:hypothetical protein FA95DRAFT_638111 [Auriscalpium vulgare]|uniref:Uncharacterized protein n=1 Tax=Auriscalpium vulgare TaxID=40419 RepID=A0ACB8RDC6_9AGAM|nr:hypothetical protein FA95DRAFT_638111 [Auriscalpium vulgare]